MQTRELERLNKGDHKRRLRTVPTVRLVRRWMDVGYPLRTAGEPAVAPGATFLEPEKLTTAKYEVETGDLWSEGRLLIWSPGREGETLTLKIPVEKKGAYTVRLGMAIDPDSGVVSAKLDGKPFGFGGGSEGMPLHSVRRTMLRASESESVELNQGEHTLVLRYEGGAPRVGIDFVWLQPDG